MPRSSFSENPLLRVSRPVSACSRCRSAKVKCDGKLPACTACEKAGRENECSAANDQFARGKERSYVAALELRIEKLERRLAYAQSRKDSVSLHDPDTAQSSGSEGERKDSLATIRAAIHRKAARTRENSDINSLVSDFGYLSVNATTRDFEPSVTNMTFARLVLAASTNDPIPDSQDTRLPSRQTAHALMTYYMNNIYILFPAFSDALLYALLDDMYNEDRRPTRSSDYWLVWMVLAIGSTAQSRRSGDEHYTNGVEFVARALPYADRALMPGYAHQIQSLLLLTQYAMLDPAHFDTWHLMGFTCRAITDLGYHQDPPQGQSPDKASQDAKRRTFYCVYALDRAISMVHARAFSFQDDSINVSLPGTRFSRNGSIAGPAPVASPTADPALLLFKLRQIQSNWYQTLLESDPNDPLPDAQDFVWKSCLNMRTWAEALPDGLPVGIREMFDLELRYSYCYCIAPSARAPQMTPYGKLLIFEHAIAYLDRIYEVASSLNTAFYTYHDALRVYFMGVQFVTILRDAGDSLLSGADVPVPLPLPGKAPPPPLPERFDHDTSGDNLDRSLRSLERVGLTLRIYSERWDNAFALMENFQMISADVMEGLGARKAMRDSAARQMAQQRPQIHPQIPQPQVMHGMPQHPMAQHVSPQQPQQEVRWVDLDVSQMIQRGGQV
ncbi:hypothetical protein GQ53DRAFT_742632 [Thozetella sp. PMI_491]|nr:hypothetical protein GQ53DRAFT_742632 [Thozetella sp. PMI_491]